MSVTYKVKGTLRLNYICDKVEFLVFADAAYLSPDKKHAVLYPSPDPEVSGKTTENKSLEALMVKLIEPGDKYILLSVGPDLKTPNEKLESLLIQLALQNKPVELHVDGEGKIITGFTYPVR